MKTTADISTSYQGAIKASSMVPVAVSSCPSMAMCCAMPGLT
jgi:hypothetical protein